MRTCLRLEAVSRTAFDEGLARLGGGRLTRAEGVTYLECDRVIEDATYQLALAGVRGSAYIRVPAPATGQRPAIGLDLVPLERSLPALDVVEIQCVSLGDASAALMHRRLPWSRIPHATRNACRRLLREEDAILAWRRTVWCSTASMREARSRRRVRPVVFDHTALARHPRRWTYVSEGALERWAFP